VMSQPLELDVAIFGGGVAGLWTLARLIKQGFNAHLFECNQLGAGQSIASQGIIHGGTKYALTGKITGASEAIREMPSIWSDCLSGKGELDLSAVKITSSHQLLWTQADLKSKVGGFFASKVMSSRMTKLDATEIPGIFQHSGFKGTVYRLDEQVIDPASLFENLFSQLEGHLSFYKRDQLDMNQGLNGEFRISGLQVNAKAIVLTAGEGNAGLLHVLGCNEPAMQRRPLHMPMVKSKLLPQLTAHALGDGALPRMTITANHDLAGDVVWYLGGKIAEEGIEASQEVLIQKAKDELTVMLPWVDWRSMEWSTVMLNRAEPLMSDGGRPDRPYIHSQKNILTAWPVKLAFAPLLAQEVLSELANIGIEPSHTSADVDLPKPSVAKLPWDEVASWS